MSDVDTNEQREQKLPRYPCFQRSNIDRDNIAQFLCDRVIAATLNENERDEERETIPSHSEDGCSFSCCSLLNSYIFASTSVNFSTAVLGIKRLAWPIEDKC